MMIKKNDGSYWQHCLLLYVRYCLLVLPIKSIRETLPEEDIYEQTDNSVAEDDKEASEPMDTDQDKKTGLCGIRCDNRKNLPPIPMWL